MVDPDGFLLTVRLDHMSVDRVEGVVVVEREHRPEPTAHITIAIANLPAPALELVLSRCTEVGAFAFHIVQAESKVEELLAVTEQPVMLVRGAATHLAGLSEPRDPTLLIGPEGGWSPREEALVATKAGLGPRNLRADTAAVVALGVALAARKSL